MKRGKYESYKCTNYMHTTKGLIYIAQKCSLKISF